jgi:hypothetical protein
MLDKQMLMKREESETQMQMQREERELQRELQKEREERQLQMFQGMCHTTANRNCLESSRVRSLIILVEKI